MQHSALYPTSYPVTIAHPIPPLLLSLYTPQCWYPLSYPFLYHTPLSFPLSTPFSADNVQFEKDLMDIARTTLSSKLLNVEKDHFARYTKLYSNYYDT
jgi:hypothetical protein